MMILNVCGIVIPMSAYLFGNDMFVNNGSKDIEKTWNYVVIYYYTDFISTL